MQQGSEAIPLHGTAVDSLQRSEPLASGAVSSTPNQHRVSGYDLPGAASAAHHISSNAGIDSSGGILEPFRQTITPLKPE